MPESRKLFPVSETGNNIASVNMTERTSILTLSVLWSHVLVSRIQDFKYSAATDSRSKSYGQSEAIPSYHVPLAQTLSNPPI
jgi:hypothetical protein